MDIKEFFGGIFKEELKGEKCSWCGGYGWLMTGDRCRMCNGTGRINEKG